MEETLHKYGRYTRDEGWRVYAGCERALGRLQVHHLLGRLRAGERPAECVPAPPAGRTLVEFAAAAWTPFYGRVFRDRTVPGHHREPRWLAFTAALAERMARDAALPLAEAAERLFAEVASAAVEEDLARQAAAWDEPCPFGAFRYDAHDDYAALHFHNVCMPDSPFAEPARLFRSLAAIAAEIRERAPAVRRIGVDSWIDHLPVFQALFPPAFAASLAPTDPDNKGGNGWWGQFIRRTGGLHEERAERLRRTRQFEFPRAHGECAFDDFCRHVTAHA